MPTTISRWVEHQEEIGGLFFSLADVCAAFPKLSRQVVENALQRLRVRGRIYSPYCRFYVILPATYRIRGSVPPMFYMDDLMRQLGRRYYFSLLSASAILGAAHQRPQVDFISVEGSTPFSSRKDRRDVVWVSRSGVPDDFIVKRNGEAGDIRYSNAELTAVELVQYEHRVGGLSAVATVLRELLENTNFAGASKGVFGVCKDTSVQRLGYLVDRILHDEEQAEVIYGEWRRVCLSPHYVVLSSKSSPVGFERDNKWKIAINVTVEEDEQ